MGGVRGKISFAHSTLLDWDFLFCSQVESTILYPREEGVSGIWSDLCAVTYEFTYSFINTRNGGSGWLPGNFSIRPKVVNLLRDAGLSDVLLCGIWNEWAKMSEYCFTNKAIQVD